MSLRGIQRYGKLVGLLIAAGLANVSTAADHELPRLPPQEDPPATFGGWPLLFHDDFAAGNATRWDPTDDSAWRVSKQGSNVIYALIKKESDYTPPVRSPLNRSLINDLTVGSFVLDVRLQSTTADYPHRSLCLFFGYQDDAHLYYVHFGKVADDHANQVFIVNGEPRKKISTTSTPGTNWDDDWHHARIMRDVTTGSIRVYFDDMDVPVMTAKDDTFTWGRVGVGSFDDTGNFDEVIVFGDVKKASPIE